MSFRPRGIIHMLTLAGTLAGLGREERRNPLKVQSTIQRRELYFGHGSYGHNNKRLLRKLRQRRTRNKLARMSRRRNRAGA